MTDDHFHGLVNLKLKYQEEYRLAMETMTTLRQSQSPTDHADSRSSRGWWSLCPWECYRVDKEAGCSGKQMQMRGFVGEFWVESAECRGQRVLGLRHQ